MSQKTFEDYLKATPAERRKMNMNEILGEERLANIRKQMLNEIKDTLQEDKELLLKDLCGRLPYRVNIQVKEGITLDTELKIGHINRLQNDDIELKPYLRPMSSMTTEEWIEYCDCCLEDEKDEIIIKQTGYRIIPTTHKEHFFNSHHFDYRGLIPMGLALEATEGMYEIHT